MVPPPYVLTHYGARLAQRVEHWAELQVEVGDGLLLLCDTLGGVTIAVELQR